MPARDLDLKELLRFDSDGGILRVANERGLLFDAVAPGLLRGELIETLGVAGARAILTRFGYAHGWRTAENLRSALPKSAATCLTRSRRPMCVRLALDNSSGGCRCGASDLGNEIECVDGSAGGNTSARPCSGTVFPRRGPCR